MPKFKWWLQMGLDVDSKCRVVRRVSQQNNQNIQEVCQDFVWRGLFDIVQGDKRVIRGKQQRKEEQKGKPFHHHLRRGEAFGLFQQNPTMYRRKYFIGGFENLEKVVMQKSKGQPLKDPQTFALREVCVQWLSK